MKEEFIKFETHNLAWAKTFEQQSELLKTQLSEYITAVHHIGSTAVPSIKAKAIIDITVESSVYPPSNLIVNSLIELGYSSHGNSGVTGRYWFSKGVPRVFNLHWCPINGAVVKSQLRFRDALKADETLAKEYETLKIKASYGKHIDSPEYAASKDNFIKSVLLL